MFNIKILLLFILTAVRPSYACVLGGGSYNASSLNTSMIEVISNQEKFDEKVITIQGVLDIEPRNLFIFVGAGFYEHYSFKNSFRIKVDKVVASKIDFSILDKLQGKHVSITGKYVKSGDSRTSGLIVDLEQICKTITRTRDNQKGVPSRRPL